VDQRKGGGGRRWGGGRGGLGVVPCRPMRPYTHRHTHTHTHTHTTHTQGSALCRVCVFTVFLHVYNPNCLVCVWAHRSTRHYAKPSSVSSPPPPSSSHPSIQWIIHEKGKTTSFQEASRRGEQRDTERYYMWRHHTPNILLTNIVASTHIYTYTHTRFLSE